jgi:cytochrome c oxidase cbb3-type subunit 3
VDGMSTQTRDELSEFEYDGIREYENPCPGWWNFIFLATFVFSIGYFIFYTFNPAAGTLQQSYDEAVAADLRLQFSEIGELKPDEATLVKYMGQDKWLKVGRTVFSTNCQTCHGADASGLVGPNLTDDHYKNIKKIADIARVISEGAANGAMPAWKTRLHVNELVLVSAYVASLRGQNLPGPRGAEGEVIPPWPKASASDSAAPAGGKPGQAPQGKP